MDGKPPASVDTELKSASCIDVKPPAPLARVHPLIKRNIPPFRACPDRRSGGAGGLIRLAMRPFRACPHRRSGGAGG